MEKLAEVKQTVDVADLNPQTEVGEKKNEDRVCPISREIVLPILQDGSSKTNASNVNDPIVTNEIFLNEITGNAPEDQSVLVSSFHGHPGNVPSVKWISQPWYPGMAPLRPQNNNYFTQASFYYDAEGKIRRTKNKFAAQHVLVLDDVGTKAGGLEKLPLPPSYLLETSPGNYQVGFILRKPTGDGKRVERLWKKIIAAGFCDPGADGPLTRNARLPVGVNGKYEPPFTCRLRQWSPECRYSIEEIEKGFGLDAESIETEECKEERQSSLETSATTDGIYIPAPLENPVINSLRVRGLYIKFVGKGRHEITCPWKEEHTDGLGGGTYYYDPAPSYVVGGFKCFHGHCIYRTIKHLLEKLGVRWEEALNRPTIRCIPGHLNLILDYLEQELTKAQKFYQQGNLIVHIVRNKETRDLGILVLKYADISRAISILLRFERCDKRSKEWYCCDPPEKYCRMLIESSSYQHLPVLCGIARQPYLRQDGTLMKEPGYDPDTGFFGDFLKHEFAIRDNLSKKDAESALAMINYLLSDFPFESDNDYAAALSAILTATIRPSLRLAPMFLCSAPSSGSGKSYLAVLISKFTTSASISGTTFPRDDEECKKFLLAQLLNNPPVIFFDNLTSDVLAHNSLCIALTEESMMGRVLGVSKTATVRTHALFIATGNNVGPVQDMSRRTICIRLEPDCEVPAARIFLNDPLRELHKRRAAYVKAALVIIRAWICAGRPCTDAPSISNYDEWSDYCRQPLLWLGLPDPAKSLFQSIDNDPDRETLGRMQHAWYEIFKNRPTMVREAIDNATTELHEVFMDVAGEGNNLNRKRLGRWISKRANRIVDGKKFERDRGGRSAEAWRVVSVS